MDPATDNIYVAEIREHEREQKRTISPRQQFSFFTSGCNLLSFSHLFTFQLPFSSSSSTAFTLRDSLCPRFMYYDDFYDSVNPAFIPYITPTVRWHPGSAPLPVIHLSLRSQRSDSAWLKKLRKAIKRVRLGMGFNREKGLGRGRDIVYSGEFLSLSLSLSHLIVVQ